MQYLQRFDCMEVGDFDSFNHNPLTSQNIPIQNPVRHVPAQGGPSSSKSQCHRHGLQDEVISETSVQNTEASAWSQHSLTGNQFTTSMSLTMTDVHVIPSIQLSAFGPQVTPSLHSPHIGLDVAPSPQFPPFSTHPTPSPHFLVFGEQFPSSSHVPPFGYAVTALASSFAPKLHPIFTFLAERVVRLLL